MRTEDLFRIEFGIDQIAEEIKIQGHISQANADKFKSWLYDFFKKDEIANANPQEAVDIALKYLLDPSVKMGEFIRKNRLNAVLQGAKQAAIPVDNLLRKHVEQAIHESRKEVDILDESISPEGQSEINGVLYDQQKGLGAVPYNQDVLYFGAPVLMKPSTFLSLALRLDPAAATSTNDIKELIQGGKPIGSPWLYIEFGRDADDNRIPEGARIVGHEGRNRASAIKQLHGDVDMMVHLIYAGARSRDISPEFLQKVNQGQIRAEKGPLVSGPFWKPL